MNESFKVPVTKETLAVATQKHGPFFATGRGRPEAVAHLHRRRTRDRRQRQHPPDRPPARASDGRHRPHAAPAPADPAPRPRRRACSRRGRRRARFPRSARPHPSPHGDRGANRGDRRAERARARQRPRRALAPRQRLQHDARCARRVARDAAPVRRGRFARAAHAADEHADEHRGAEAVTSASTRKRAGVSSTTSSAKRTRCAI